MLIVTFLSDDAGEDAGADADAEADELPAEDADGEAFPLSEPPPQPARATDRPVTSMIGAIAFLFTFTSPYLTMCAASVVTAVNILAPGL